MELQTILTLVRSYHFYTTELLLQCLRTTLFDTCALFWWFFVGYSTAVRS